MGKEGEEWRGDGRREMQGIKEKKGKKGKEERGNGRKGKEGKEGGEERGYE